MGAILRPSVIAHVQGPAADPSGAELLADEAAYLAAVGAALGLAHHEADEASVEAAVAAFREQLDAGYYAVVSTGEGSAEQVTELPRDAELVILRRPIAGG